MVVARWGVLPLLICAGFVAGGAVLMPSGWPRVAWLLLGGCIWLFTLAFFRNPRRVPPEGEHLLVSAADGVVADVEEVDEPLCVGGRALRIGVFMNVFNVHVNRAPISGRIVYASYRPGRFLDVRHPDASHENEANSLGLATDPAVVPGGPRILLRQLSGLIARRIVCTHGCDDVLRRGEIFGMIKFGSRVEHYVPLGSGTLAVAVGQGVRAGESVLFEFGPAGEV